MDIIPTTKEDVFIDISLGEFRKRFAGVTEEKDYADAYAIAHNNWLYFCGDEYQHEEGSQEYQAIVEAVEEWGDLLDDYQGRLIEIIRSEGVTIPEFGWFDFLKPLMKLYGYTEDSGWWCKESEEEIYG